MSPRLRRRTPGAPTRHRMRSTANTTKVGGHLLAANRDRGLGPHTATVHRYRYFVTMPKRNPRDKPNTHQGTRQGLK